MTKDELRWILREYDDDTPILVANSDGTYRNVALRLVEREVVGEDGRKEWVLVL